MPGQSRPAQGRNGCMVGAVTMTMAFVRSLFDDKARHRIARAHRYETENDVLKGHLRGLSNLAGGLQIMTFPDKSYRGLTFI